MQPIGSRRDRAVILAAVVLAAVILGLGLYSIAVLVTPGPSSDCDVCKPAVTFGTPTAIADGERVPIAAIVAGSHAIYYFRVGLFVNGNFTSIAFMPSTNNGSVILACRDSCAPATLGNFTVRWMDSDLDGRLSAGESFTITQSGGLPSPRAYTFYLLWTDGSTVAYADFQTS